MEFKVGQKAWSIQLGACEVVEMTNPNSNTYIVRCKNHSGYVHCYSIEGKCLISDKHPSLFHSNPFENQFKERVMWVSDDGLGWVKRVVFMKKCDKYLSWDSGETIESAKKIGIVTSWGYAKEIEELPLELTLKQVAEKFGVDNVKIVEG